MHIPGFSTIRSARLLNAASLILALISATIHLSSVAPPLRNRLSSENIATPDLLYSRATRFTGEQGSCQILGDSDVYGLGIRLNYYLQWAAIVFATWIAPEQVEPARLTSNVVTIAVYVNTFLGVRHDSLIAAEWWIVYFMTFVLTLGFIPTSTILLRKSIYSFGFLGLLWSMIIFAECWVWFKGVDIGHRDGCIVKIYFLFFKVNVENKTWRTMFKIESIVACVVGAGVLLYGLFLLYSGWFGEKVDDGGTTKAKNEKATIYTLNGMLMAFQLVTGALAILQIEMTLKINDIDIQGAPLTSSGQLIPFVAGIFTLAATFGAGFNHLMKDRIRIRET
jgi:hypothetical protein